MTQRKDGGTAFPMQDFQAIHAYAMAAIDGITDTDERDRVYILAKAEAVGGMSLRDYLAAKAMQGLLSKHGGFVDDLTRPGTTQDFSEDAPDIDEVAGYAYAMADAMLAARERS